MYPYGLIGNCQVSALVNSSGAIDWLCMPRPDSPPVFGAMLDPNGGSFEVRVPGKVKSTQRYLPNTNVLETILEYDEGAVRITDFCPRFVQYGRVYRPASLFRIVEPLRGSPMIEVSCSPCRGWSKEPAKPVRGNSHIRYEIGGEVLRLTTNMPLTYLMERKPFALQEPLSFALTWGVGLEDDLERVTREFYDRTVSYWQRWVKHCHIPSTFQNETIRSALALKMHVYEDTGAILAASTTSLPEEIGSNRNWDYRFCWLRDSYFVLNAFHRLGHFEEMEGFMKFLLEIGESEEKLAPLYSLDASPPIEEREHPEWAGYLGSRPVRSNNQASEHVQNDVYGELILALAPIYLDERFSHLRRPEHEKLMIRLAKMADRTIGEKDAGIWEHRDGWKEHSFTNLMCWAGLDRTEMLRKRGFLKGLPDTLADGKERAARALERATKGGTLRNAPGDDSFDCSLLLLPVVRYPDEAMVRKTVLETCDALRVKGATGRSPYLYRYSREDDFGKPKSAFLICSFWEVQALARLGHIELAREQLKTLTEAANGVGLFAEHFEPATRRQLGNFPQCYSHVGLINAAFAVSPSWDELL